MRNSWDAVANMYMLGEMNDTQAVQMLEEEYDNLDVREHEVQKSLGRFLFEGDEEALSEAQRSSTKLLINSLKRGSIYHDNVIGLKDVVSLAAGDFVKNRTIAGFEYGTGVISKGNSGIHIQGWRSQVSIYDQHIKGLPQTNLIFQDSVFHYNADLPIPFPPVKVGDCPNAAEICIESDSDVIKTPAGRFENCLRLKKPDHKPEEIFIRFAGMPDVPITKIGWYALGVGMVKFQVIQGENIKEFQLLDYEAPPTKTNSYFPVNIGVKWVYEWQSERFLCREISRPVDIVDRRSDGSEYMHIHFGTLYALRKGAI